MSDRILVVEDDDRLRTVLLRFLSREGYEPAGAGTGAEGLERVRALRPDLVLLDVRLPGGMDGFEVCRRIKEDPATALIPVTILTGLEDAESRRRGIESGADDFLTKPFEYGLLRARVRTQLRIKGLVDQLENTERVIFSMARWVEVKDPYTEGHLRRIAGYSERIAEELGLGSEQRRIVRYGGILHDIGKVAIHDSILGKPGPLSPDEQEELRRHTDYGAAIVAPLRFAAEVAPIIRAHHEHWDGRGYPQGLAGEAIPIGARIIAVVDAWDAMTTDRPYRRSLDRAEAIRRLRAGAGSQWDPRVVETLLDLLADGKLHDADLPEALAIPDAPVEAFDRYGDPGRRAA